MTSVDDRAPAHLTPALMHRAFQPADRVETDGAWRTADLRARPDQGVRVLPGRRRRSTSRSGRGEAFGFLGPNGAGKSSTMRMIAAVSPRSGGELRVLGLDPDRDGPAIRARLGVVPQEDNLDLELTVRENLYVYGRYFDLPRRELRDLASSGSWSSPSSTERADDRVEPLSGGMKRRLTIARSLVNEPDLLLLDEPTTGLDPQARHALWDRLYRLKAEGVTLVLTTHYMDEAEQLCDRLVVMDGGRIAAEGSPPRADRAVLDQGGRRAPVRAG